MPNSKTPVTENEERLWTASERYIRGEISREDVKEIDRQISQEADKETQRPSLLNFLKDVLTHPFNS